MRIYDHRLKDTLVAAWHLGIVYRRESPTVTETPKLQHTLFASDSGHDQPELSGGHSRRCVASWNSVSFKGHMVSTLLASIIQHWHLSCEAKF